MARKTRGSQSVKKFKNKHTLETVLPWLLIAGGTIALIASILLSIEVFNRLKNPAFVPICNLNPILSCTSVADSSQAHLFGFPNYFIGIAGYAIVAMLGVVMLAGAKLAKWFWQAIEIGLLFSIGFVTWLQFETLYRIGALCIFCMIVWACTMPVFWYTTLYTLDSGNIVVPSSLKSVAAFARRHHGDILLLWYLIILALILNRFWYYWSTLI